MGPPPPPPPLPPPAAPHPTTPPPPEPADTKPTAAAAAEAPTATKQPPDFRQQTVGDFRRTFPAAAPARTHAFSSQRDAVTRSQGQVRGRIHAHAQAHGRRDPLHGQRRPEQSVGSPLPHLHRDRARLVPTSAPGLGSPPPHLHRDWTQPRHICARTGRGRSYLAHNPNRHAPCAARAMTQPSPRILARRNPVRCCAALARERLAVLHHARACAMAGRCGPLQNSRKGAEEGRDGWV